MGPVLYTALCVGYTLIKNFVVELKFKQVLADILIYFTLNAIFFVLELIFIHSK